MKKLFSALHPAKLVSTCFFVGKIPFMPGTWGSFVTALFVFFVFYQPHFRIIDDKIVLDYASGIIQKDLILPFLIGCTIASSILGIYCADVYEKMGDIEDPSEVVIDEVAGMLLSYTSIAIIYAGLIKYNPLVYTQLLIATPVYFVTIFVLFRIFDITKFWHIGKAESKFCGGFGIMVDDLIAGVYTCITFYILFFAAKYTGLLNLYFETFFQ